jgi:hypothetical protein
MTSIKHDLMPGDFQVGSFQSRASARALLDRGTVIRVRIVHLGHDGKKPLPPRPRCMWKGGTTEIVHIVEAKG